MTTDTQLKPTNTELWQLHMQLPGRHKDPIDFARAVLAEWGQPAHSGEPVATVQTIHGVTVGYLETAVPAGTKLYTAPQPVEREPLTDAQIKGLIEGGVFFGNCKEIVRAIEAAHGISIKGGHHGPE